MLKKLNVNNVKDVARLPEKVLMFGEGNFLRAFAAVIIKKLNDKGLFGGSIVALQGTEEGRAEDINSQDGLYTVIERGVEGGRVVERSTLIDCVSRCVNPYTDYGEFLLIAQNPQLQVIFSNTTEFGICYSPEETAELKQRRNFPAKLTDFLWQRYKHFDGDIGKGLVIFPCELIDDNGKRLKQLVYRYAQEWELESGFFDWLSQAVTFCGTLVDRIVSGYPKEEEQKLWQQLGYEDKLMDICEPFLFFAVEASQDILRHIPLEASGLDIVVTDDISPYRRRKVRILNGAHTMSVLAGHLSGLQTVEQLVNDEVFGEFIRQGISQEIIPCVGAADAENFADQVLERFKNPFLHHRLLSISLNSLSKFKSRVLPSIVDYTNKFGKAPKLLSFSLAALIKFYKEGIDSFVTDEKQYTDRLQNIFKGKSAEYTVKTVLGEVMFWGSDLNKLNGLCAAVTEHYLKINSAGVKTAAAELLA